VLFRSFATVNAEVLVDSPTLADSRYFDPAQLGQDQLRREWRSQVWWPDEQLFDKAAEDVRVLPPIGSMAHGRTWIALRSDMTDDLQPAALFGQQRVDQAVSQTPGPDF
jgi:hypothetical protein